MQQITHEQAEQFHYEQYSQGVLIIWSITHGTKDFGDRYTARPIRVPHPVSPNKPIPLDEDGYLIADTLDEIRELLPVGLTWMNRYDQDDPVIVETWV